MRGILLQGLLEAVPMPQGPSGQRTAKEDDFKRQIQRERRRRYAERDALIRSERGMEGQPGS